MTGVVIDSLSGKAIPYAKVTALGWRKTGMDEQTYDKIDTVTDAQGRFTISFPETFKVDIGTIAQDYYPTARSISRIADSNKVEMYLKKNDSGTSFKNLGQLALFERSYIASPDKEKEYFGIDVLNFKNTVITDSMDVGFIPQSNPNIETMTLFAGNKGGIIPIIGNPENYAIPTRGYVNKYKLTGKEKGFFVKCRDGRTLARVSIFSEYDRSAPYKNGHQEDKGIMFNISVRIFENYIDSEGFRLDYYILQAL